MKRFNIHEMVNMPHEGPVTSYKDQVAIMNVPASGMYLIRELFAVDAFIIGYVTQGYSITEFNSNSYPLNVGNAFILAPTHSCRIIEWSPDYMVRLLLLDSNGHNLSVHLNYMVKSERWINTYFYPVIKLNAEEAATMDACTSRIAEQINRRNCPNKTPFIRMAVQWHHVELDNIMQEHANDHSDNNIPLTRKQVLARQLYRLIANNYRQQHQVKFYAEQMCLTPQYLNKITSDIFGKTLSAIIYDLLFTTARTMILSSEMSIQEISNELNFPDQASFCKFIKKTTGTTPTLMRKTNPHQETI